MRSPDTGFSGGLGQDVAEESTFDFLCSELELGSDLDRLEARGTVRIAVKQAGLDPHTATPRDLAVVAQKVLPGELAARGIDDSGALCSSLAKRVAAFDAGEAQETPEAIFARLGGR
jgi:hypothetical protein